MKETSTGSRTDERGNVLVVTLLVLFAISVIGFTMAMVSSMDLRISGNQRTTTQSLFVAEAGLNEAIHRLSLPNPTNVAVSGWTGNVAIGDSEPYNPNWGARIYLTAPGSAPAGNANLFTTGTIQDPGRPYLEYSEPNGADRVLSIEHKWRDLDGDGSRDANEIMRWDPMQIPPENFNSGFPIEIVTVTGQAADGERVIQAEVTKRTIIVRTLGALYCDKAIRLTGNCDFCGYNHDLNTPPWTVPNACSAWHLASGHLPGVVTTGDDVKTQGSANVAGNPAPINMDPTNPFYSLSEVLGLTPTEVADMLANADNTSIKNPLNGITYIQGDAKITSNFTGQGLIYVTGDLSGAGSFNFKGLVYVEGDLKYTGTPWILGSVIVRGTSDWNFSAGNAAVLYSRDAITQALSGAMPCIVLSWREM
ncbi:MAG: PilX N-terminal domain-containing pilus assembly protein [Candidatus Krumholzibacteria bacterium]|nr:PilX N-terminal domain-containing pilus assembly protein [Candidatus Krumholzibacteria bacterium]